MHLIRDACQHPMQWSSRGFTRRDLQLIAGLEVVATLFWPNLLGTLAEARAADGEWTFENASFFGGGILVRTGNGQELAEFQTGWLGDGTLTFPSGPAFTWRGEGFWRRDWMFFDAAGHTLMRCHKTDGFFSPSDEVVVDPHARELPQLSLLVLLSQYLRIRMEDTASPAPTITPQ